jgi:hypothetical protein
MAGGGGGGGPAAMCENKTAKKRRLCGDFTQKPCWFDIFHQQTWGFCKHCDAANTWGSYETTTTAQRAP